MSDAAPDYPGRGTVADRNLARTRGPTAIGHVAHNRRATWQTWRTARWREAAETLGHLAKDGSITMQLSEHTLTAIPIAAGACDLNPRARTDAGTPGVTGIEAEPARHRHEGGGPRPPARPRPPVAGEVPTGETADPETGRRGLSRDVAARCRATLESAGLGPVEIRHADEGSGLDCVLVVRIGPFRRVVSTEVEVQALLEERQTCYF